MDICQTFKAAFYDLSIEKNFFYIFNDVGIDVVINNG